MHRPLVAAVCMGLALAASGAALAEDPVPGEEQPLHHHHQRTEGTPPPGKPRCIPHTDERAGLPRALAGHLQQSTTAGGIGYYVGGGVLFGHGQPRRREEGTWGWDETGSRLFRRRNILGWSHGRKYQGGTGAYAVDGPHVPDVVFGITAVFDRLRP
jgi:hypothetical protein